MTSEARVESSSIALAHFVADTTSIPTSVAARAEAMTYDTLSKLYRGERHVLGAAAFEALVRTGCAAEATVFGRDVKVPAQYAAFINVVGLNVTSSRTADDVIVLAALATAERAGSTPARLLRGVAIGREVGARLMVALGQSHHARGYATTGTAGRVGATAAVAVVLDLAPDQVLAAFGCASTMAAGLDAGRLDAARPSFAGMAACDAVQFASLAATGLIGPPMPLEGRRGLLALESSDAREGALVERLGEDWESESGMSPSGVSTPRNLSDFETLAELLGAVVSSS